MIKYFDLLLLICFTQTQMENELPPSPTLSDEMDEEVLLKLAGMLWIVTSSIYMFISLAHIDEKVGRMSGASPIGTHVHFSVKFFCYTV